MKLKIGLIPCALLVLPWLALGEEPAGSGALDSMNTFAMVEVLSCDTNTVIAVPWAFYTSNGEPTVNLPIDRLVRPTNLSVGDYVLMHLPNPTKPTEETYAAWQLTKTTEPVPGVAEPSSENDRDWCWKWEPVMTVTANPGESGANAKTRTDVWTPEGGGVPAECRGYGVWLLRQNPVDGDGNARPFYLYGQWTTGGTNVTISAGTTGAPASDDNPVCTMLANPDCLHETDVNSLGWKGVGSTDTLIITTDAKTTLYCTYRKNGGDKARWGYSTQTRVNKGTAEKPYWVVQTRRVDAPKVPAGTGFWYVRRTNDVMTLTWPAPTEGTSSTTGE